MAAYKAHFKDTFSKIITAKDVARAATRITSQPRRNSLGGNKD